MNTFLSSAQEAVVEQYRTFACQTVAPVARQLESHQICLKEFLQDLGQKGYLAISVPREYGGQGLPFLNCVLFVETLSEQEAGLGLTLANHFAVIECLKKFGSETQKSRYLPLLARGEAIGTLAFSEEQAGSDVAAVQSTLSASGADYVLNGRKSWVVTGDFASLYLILAKSSDAGSSSLTSALIDTGEKKGIEIGPDLTRLGLRSAYINNVDFQSVKLTKDALLISAKVEVIHEFAMDVAKVLLAASAVGLCQAAIEAAVSHARKREQFGKTIGQFQGVQWKLADMETEKTAALLQVYRAAWSLEEDGENFAKNAAMSKWFAAKVARFHSGEAMQILGAHGFGEDCLMEKMYCDAKAMEICLGTSEMQKVQLVKELKI